jgi:hypothetical protein
MTDAISRYLQNAFASCICRRDRHSASNIIGEPTRTQMHFVPRGRDVEAIRAVQKLHATRGISMAGRRHRITSQLRKLSTVPILAAGGRPCNSKTCALYGAIIRMSSRPIDASFPLRSTPVDIFAHPHPAPRRSPLLSPMCRYSCARTPPAPPRPRITIAWE